jgi:hypothetical protein
VFDSGLQSLAACVAYPYTPTGAGATSPISAQLSSGLPADFGPVMTAADVFDDFGQLGGAVLGGVDLGAA